MLGMPGNTDDGSSQDSRARAGQKRKTRAKYTSKACDDCRERKVKCCGGLPCSRCLARKVSCSYDRESNNLSGEVVQSWNCSPRTDQNDTTGKNPPPNNGEQNEREKKFPRKHHTSIGSLKRENETKGDCLVLSTSSLDSNSANETDTFELEEDVLDYRTKQPLSLQSKLTAICNTLSVQPMRPRSLSLPQCLPQTPAAPHRPSVVLELPSPLQLHRLLHVFFTELNPYFPCLPQDTFETRLLTILKDQGYKDEMRRIRVQKETACHLALLCVVLALATFVNPEPLPEDKTPLESECPRGWEWHQKSRQLRHFFRSTAIPNMDAARNHVLESMYLVHTERLEESCDSIARAVVAAQAIGLNDQATWPILSPPEFLSRRMLWWIIYYQDRRVAEKLGRPYIARDTEINVDDFSTKFTNEGGPSPDENTILYTQTLVDWGRAWSKVWDTLFSPSVKNLGNQDAIDAMDCIVLEMEHNLPFCLTYDQGQLNNGMGGISSGEERLMRYRILCHTRINLLRLIIRHNPLSVGQEDVQTAGLCASLARSTISNLCSYLTPDRRVNQMGHFATASLVECLCHLISALASSPYLRDQVDDQENGLVAARNLLRRFSPRLGAATRALRLMDPLLSAAADLSKDGLRFPVACNAVLEEQDGFLWPDTEGLPTWKSLSYGILPFETENNCWTQDLWAVSASGWSL